MSLLGPWVLPWENILYVSKRTQEMPKMYGRSIHHTWGHPQSCIWSLKLALKIFMDWLDYIRRSEYLMPINHVSQVSWHNSCCKMFSKVTKSLQSIHNGRNKRLPKDPLIMSLILTLQPILSAKVCYPYKNCRDSSYWLWWWRWGWIREWWSWFNLCSCEIYDQNDQQGLTNSSY